MAHERGVRLHADQRPRRQRRAAVRPRRRRRRSRRPARSRPAAPASPRSAAARAPSRSAATAATCYAGQRRLRQRLGVPRRPPPDASLLGSVPSGGVAPDSVDEDRGRVYVLNSGATPSVSAFWRRVDGSLKRDPRRHARARARRRRRRAGLGHARRALAGGHRARSPTGSRRCRSTASGAPARRSSRRRAARCRSASRITRRGDVVVSEAGASTGLVVPRRRSGHARAPSPPRCPSASARRAGSRCRPTGASPTPATPAAASAASRSRATAR